MDSTATLDDLSYDGRRDVRILWLTDVEDGLEVITDDAIELRYRLLVVEVTGISQASEEVLGTDFFAKVNRQSLEVHHLYLVLVTKYLL